MASHNTMVVALQQRLAQHGADERTQSVYVGRFMSEASGLSRFQQIALVDQLVSEYTTRP